MPFKKLHTIILNTLDDLGFHEPYNFQKNTLSKIKGGANVFGLAPKSSGKTTTLIISVVNKLKASAFEDSPRALIFVKDKKAALTLKEAFNVFTKHTDLRVYTAYDEQNIDTQKDEIYYGQDIVIATPKRLSKLYHINGIHLGELQLLCIEDAEFLAKNNLHAEIIRLSESIKKCQYLVFSDKYYPKFDKFRDSFMNNSEIIQL